MVDIEDLYMRYGDDYLCKRNDTCNCVDIKLELWALAGINTTLLQTGRYFNGTATDVEDCLNAEGRGVTGGLTFMKELEEGHSCSGVCDVRSFYMFNDIRR
jgi:hypothetical protein